MSKLPEADCEFCPYIDCKLIPPRGEEDCDLIIVGEIPGKTELRMGKPFVGQSGILLQRILDANEIKNPWVTNVIPCYSEDAGKHNIAAIHCRKRLLREIQEARTNKILALGVLAMETLIPFESGKLTNRRGKIVWSKEYGKWIMPTWHPAAVLRNPNFFPELSSDISKLMGFTAQAEERIDFSVADDEEQIESFLGLCDFELVLDIETTGLDIYSERILGIVLSGKAGTLIIPENLICSKKMKLILEGRSHKIKWIGHNVKFDKLALFTMAGINIRFHFDTMLAHYLTDERSGIHGLKEIARDLFAASDWEEEIKSYQKRNQMRGVPINILYKYAVYDGHYTYKLYKYMRQELKDSSFEWPFYHILMPASDALAKTELNGVKLDIDLMAQLGKQYDFEMADLEKEMRTIAGPTFNPRSPQQVAYYLYDKLGIRAGTRSTDFDTLSAIKQQYPHPLVDALLRHRRLSKLKGTYIEGLIDLIKEDGRVHPNFQLHGTVSGRLSCNEPNMQNLDRDLDNIVIPEKGNILIQGDYSQIELRMLAIQSKDPFLMNIFKTGGDLHSETATMLFGLNFTKIQRVWAKQVNFGLVYGRGAEDLARDANLPGLSIQEAQAFIEAYFKNIPKVVEWIAEVQKEVLAQGQITSLLGRVRRFPLITWNNQGDVIRKAINFMCQSPAADAGILSLVRLTEAVEGLKGRVILNVHDSIIVEAPIALKDAFIAIIGETMEDVGRELFGDEIPITVSITSGFRKGELK